MVVHNSPWLMYKEEYNSSCGFSRFYKILFYRTIFKLLPIKIYGKQNKKKLKLTAGCIFRLGQTWQAKVDSCFHSGNQHSWENQHCV